MLPSWLPLWGLTFAFAPAGTSVTSLLMLRVVSTDMLRSISF
ncbi:hypothetical protein J2S74_004153 [Evansella vedderi]|uniref:Uncharacterized protein n=1 Tax=Evansella vedderi TaxID=38282 RepID=A0ABT9ZZR7_9BACI|nr:hypothetical protein [Evansella vedderi]